MKTKWFIAIGLLAAVTITLVVISAGPKQKSEPPAAQAKPEHESAALPAPVSPEPARMVTIQPTNLQGSAQAPKREVPQSNPAQTNVVETGAAQVAKPKKSKPPIQDPVARVALSYVG